MVDRLVSRRTFLASAALASAALAFAGCSGSASSSAASASSSMSASASSSATALTASGKPSGTVVGEVPSSAKAHEQISTTLFVFDTVVTITACCSSDVLAQAAERCNYFESIFSRTIPTSDIGRINDAKGAPVAVALETADVIRKALDYSRASDGLFDITIGTVSTLWDFKEGVVPDERAVQEALAYIDYRAVDVQGTTVTLRDVQAKLDLGGIAKGFIADDLADFFIRNGCDSAYVNLGGNVKTIGLRPDGKAWHVGIQDPNDAQGTVVAAVYSQDTSVVTSGLYERQFTRDGKRYWHILDPRTGYPVETDLMSATIISDASIDGDGNTKPLFMMGCDQALAWMNRTPGIEGIVVDMQGTIHQSSGCNAELL